MRAMRLMLWISVLLVTALLAGCGQQATTAPTTAATTPATGSEEPSATPVPPTTAAESGEAYPLVTPEIVEPTAAYPEAPTTAPITVSRQADGAIQPTEYQHEQLIGNFVLWWANDAECLYMAMQGPTTGWVAVGLDPTNRMQGANYIVGAVVDGTAVIYDAFGMAPVGPNHPEDTELGGTMDIVAFAGVEKDGQTLIEFQIPLDSGDQYDKPLVPGETYPVLVATGSGDEFTATHSFRDAAEITLEPVE